MPADLVGVDRVPADSHSFEDPGADSMVMARFCAPVRKRPDSPAVSIRDVYPHPTFRDLADALAPAPAASRSRTCGHHGEADGSRCPLGGGLASAP